ncbi:protein-L-isoaspartate O-methyltransferase [Candidatus Woesebacteria bacterium RIFCSPHIGHO2_01_FULL_38_10]|uniref:Protein-L-isoaspartate O-methyltransferase n=1 Tax=Candidatus Woesebacteria bacterium RIFCSPLOWO2_01_FULL_39_10b TaxID=1802517 RepID=A0A1F8B9A5_9BACT|nr:MAG: protein-L-isoaspartate O-methyltransferase [Candidatus Woesebacteria bacterium RIFCSPHIGHO2_01_FULL_38_10]OGM59985.1 MAG: protein-L-isoaspartate O-methyltransferase [Candidatus Woesebacteria bacterium RIFCSPLOWO2_01_FULL_39_10b]
MDKRVKMVSEIKEVYGLDSSEVLSAMLQIPRDAFVPKKERGIAYQDGPVSIGYGQTMSQPYTVAFMTYLLSLKGRERVLEIGTGSGYQAAVLSKLAKEVYTIEIVDKLAKRAEKILGDLGYLNVHVRSGSGQWGWQEHAPYDAIIVTAGIEDEVPEELFRELKEGGVLVTPIGKGYNKVMTRYKKLKNGKTKKEKFGIFHFVPFVEEKN